MSVIVLFLIAAFVASAQNPVTPPYPASNDAWDVLAANSMLLWIGNNGGLAFNPMTGGPGLEWPQGSGRHLAFSQGLVWGGTIDGELHVGGATYLRAWQAGIILPDGTADDPTKPEYRIFRVHRFDPAWWNTLPETERTLLLRDLREWPAQQGAPWIDANGNGIYDPDTTAWKQGTVTDLPAMRGDAMLWFAANALDDRRMRDLYGTSAAPVEMHTLAWASAGHPLLENVIFREHTLINKGTHPIENMSLAMWEDYDLGGALDDFCGIDTSLGLAYIWNGIPWDGGYEAQRENAYGIPPAAGTLWLQTPVTPRQGATARFGDGSRQDHANLPLSGFVHYIGGSSVYRDPTLQRPEGAEMMMHNMAGRMWSGAPFVDPTTGFATPMLLAGDPVRGEGWTDGIVNSPGDRRFLSASGPFSLAPGDTQKVVFATVAATGGNQYLSVRALRGAARQLQDIYRNIPFGAPPPEFASGVSYPGQSGTFAVSVRGGPFPPQTSAVIAVLRDGSGTEIQRQEMADDGLHDDGGAGDGIYGVVLTGAGSKSGADLFVLSTDPGGTMEWFVESELPLPGPVTVSFTEILLDSPELNGQAQPGEYVRLRLRLDNGSIADMDSWHIFFQGDSSRHFDRAVQRIPDGIPAGGHVEIAYREDDPSTYIGVDIPADAVPGQYVIPVTVMSGAHCTWRQEVAFTLDSLPASPSHGLLAHVQGLATGSLGYTIVQPARLTDHDYRVSIEGEDTGEKRMHVEDVTLGSTIGYYPVPDPFAPLSPEIDGWRINIGTTFDEPVYDEQGNRLTSFTDEEQGVFEHPERSWFTPYDGILSADEIWTGTRATQYDLPTVRLVFDRTAGQQAMLYERGALPNYRYAGYYDVPLRAFDISDTTNPRQLMCGFIEQRARANDSSYMPTPDYRDREVLLIFADTYADEAAEKFRRPLTEAAPDMDLLYALWAVRDTAAPMFEDGDAYIITPRVPISNRDVYILSKPKLLGVGDVGFAPEALVLHATYPSPLRAAGSAGRTAYIRFDLPREGNVRLALYDILGRQRATIVHGDLPAGSHTVPCDVSTLPVGHYLLVLDSGTKRATRTMVIVR